MGRICRGVVFVNFLFLFCHLCAAYNRDLLKEKYLKCLVDYLNSSPERQYIYEDAILLNVQQFDSNIYKIGANIKQRLLREPKMFKQLKCVGSVQDNGDIGIVVLKNSCNCEEDVITPIVKIKTDHYTSLHTGKVNDENVQVTESKFVLHPVRLEVQLDNTLTSGEQFIAIPRVSPSVSCVGCASNVDPTAPGVHELASLGVRHLDRHKPNVRHYLKTVIKVERQTEVVNGVHIILTLIIGYNNCSGSHLQDCHGSEICKITIVEKSWLKLNDSSKFSAIISNNCTDKWFSIPESANEIKDINGIYLNSLNNHYNKNNTPTLKLDYYNKPNTLAVTDTKDSTDETYKKLVEESIEKFQRDSDSEYVYKLIKINSVARLAKRVVAGIITNIDFTMGKTNCRRTDHSSINNCQLNSESNVWKCHVVVLKTSWLEKEKHINVTCEENFIRKRRFAGSLGILGGWSEKDSNEDKYKKLAEESIEKYGRDSRSELVYKLIQVNSVAMQVVAGLNTKIDFIMGKTNCTYPHNDKIQSLSSCEHLRNSYIFKCQAVIWEREWLGMKEINVSCYETSNKTETLLNTLFHAGGEIEEGSNNAKYIYLAQESLNKYESDTGSEYIHQIIKVDRAATQMVNGRRTRIDFTIGKTDCKRNKEQFLKRKCKLSGDGKVWKCHAEILERSWLENGKEIDVNCEEKPTDESVITGGWWEKDSNEEKYKKLAEESIEKYGRDSRSELVYKLIQVNSVATQVVAGLDTKIDFIMGKTNCTHNNKIQTLSSCEYLKNSNIFKCQAVIWEREWLGKKEINVSCYETSNKTETLLNTLFHAGGEIEEDSNNAKYIYLAQESLNKYESDTDSEYIHQIIKVDRVATQMVSGVKTNIDFTVGKTDCKRTTEQSLKRDCKLSDDGNVWKCHAEILERSWLENGKEIDINCEEKPTDESVITGGWWEKDSNEEKYKKMAEEYIEKYQSDSRSEHVYKLIQVNSVATQVVAGLNTKIDFIMGKTNCTHNNKIQTLSSCEYLKNSNIFKCQAVIWEREWLGMKEINVSCYETSNKTETLLTTLFHAGGEIEEDSNNAKYIYLAQESLNKYESDTDSEYIHQIIKVDRVATQMVSGLKTNIDFTMGKTDCKRTTEQSLKRDCKLSDDGNVWKCHAEILERSWLENGKDIDVKCEEKRTNGSLILGRWSEKDSNDEEYKKLAEESLKRYQSDSGSEYLHKLIRVNSVATQVGAGVKTKIDFTIGKTNCTHNDTIQSLMTCEYLYDVNAFKCHAEILERQWFGEKHINIKCHEIGMKIKTLLQEPSLYVGGLVEEDPEKIKYFFLAQESLNKYVSDIGSEYIYQIIKVDRAATQMVSGLNTYIDFTMGKTDCKRTTEQSLKRDCKLSDDGNVWKCHAEILERSWLENGKEIDVKCKEKRIYRSVIPGGWSEKDSNEDKYKKMAEEYIERYQNDSGSEYLHKLIRVNSVVTQVGVGLKTKIDFTIGKTNCTHNDNIKSLMTCEYLYDVNAFKCHAEILERRWSGEKHNNVKCHEIGMKIKTLLQEPSFYVGGEVEEDPEKIKYLFLAQESLNKYVSDIGSEYIHQIIKVDRAATQMISGLNTYIDFTMGKTDCKRTTEQSLKRDCKLSDDGNVLKCHAKILERSWLENGKEIDVKCKEKRIYRSVIPGGWSEKDSNEDKYKKMAEEYIERYQNDSGSEYLHKLIRVNSVVTQVGVGLKTKIDFTIGKTNCTHNDNIKSLMTCEYLYDVNAFKCHAEILERQWSGEKHNNVKCHEIGMKIKTLLQEPSLYVGGEVEEDPENIKYLFLAQESLNKYESDAGSEYIHQIIKVDRAATQLVSGRRTNIDFTMGKTDCKRTTEQSLKRDCKLSDDGNVWKCHAEIMERSWLENGKEIDVKCKEKRIYRSVIPGGWSEKDSNEDKYKKMAEEYIARYQNDSGSEYLHKLIRVNSVVTQVGVGLKTKIDFTIGKTNCTHNDNIKSLMTCEYLYDVNAFKCHAEILERQWSGEKHNNVKCHEIGMKIKTLLQEPSFYVGGEVEEDPEKIKYLFLAQESLNKYESDAGSEYIHQIIKVDRAATQLVSGRRTNIDFTMGKTDCKRTTEQSLKRDCKLSDDGNVWKCHAEILERSWLENGKEIDVKCKEKRIYRSVIPGGWSEKDSNEDKYKKMAEEYIERYQNDSGSEYLHKLIRVNSVVTQVGVGLKTKIDFTIGKTNCTHNDNIKSLMTCEYLYDVNAFKCHAEILERQWSGEKHNNVKCHEIGMKIKTLLQEPSFYVGGEVEEDPEKIKYLFLAQESLNKYESDAGSEYIHQIIKVDRVATQLVSGRRTKIDFTIGKTDCKHTIEQSSKSDCKLSSDGNVWKCHAEILERSWLENAKEIDVKCEEKPTDGSIIPGGWWEQDSNDEKYKKMAEEYIERYQIDSGSEYLHKLIQVNSVAIQVVSGLNTKIDFIMGKTNCTHNDKIETLSGCEYLRNSNIFKCQALIWEKKWLGKKEINVSCYETSNKTETLVNTLFHASGEIEEDTNNAIYIYLAQESLNKYESDTGSEYIHQIIKVDRVGTQLVSGRRTNIDFTIGKTDCKRTIEQSSKRDCKLSSDGNVWKCHAEILETSWLENAKEIDVKCEEKPTDGSVIPGGWWEQDSNDEKYKKMAEEYIERYQNDSGSEYLHKLIQVNSVAIQVVAGLNTKIDFIMGKTNCTHNDKIETLSGCEYLRNSNIFKCQALIWEKKWLGKKEINVSCYETSNKTETLVNTLFHASGEIEEDSNNAIYIYLAQESLNKYESDTGSEYIHQIIKVDRVATQLVSGRRTNIDFTIGKTDCKRTIEQSSKRDCKLSSDGNVWKCHAEILETSWLENAKEIDVKCEEKPTDGSVIPGGWWEQDSNDEKYKKMAEEYIERYQNDSGSEYLHKLIQVNSVAIQVVAGLNTKIDFIMGKTNCTHNDKIETLSGCEYLRNSNIFKCQALIWEKKWLGKKEINVSCYETSNKTETLVNTLFHASGEIEEDSNNAIYIYLAQESLNKYESDTGSEYIHQIIKVDRVATQLVSGRRTNIDFTIGKTDCKRTIEQSSKRDCKLSSDGNVWKCHSEILERSWLENAKEIDVKCEEKPTDGSVIPGGWWEQDSNDEKYKKMAEEYIEKYESDSRSEHVYKLIQVNSVAIQVVAGIKTKIDLTMRKTNCTQNNDTQSLGSCEYLNNSNIFKCHAEILERQWLGKKEINGSCYETSNKTQISLSKLPLHAGGQVEEYFNNAKYIYLAQESLNKYESDTGSENIHQIIKVDRVATQMANGRRTNVDFSMGKTDCKRTIEQSSKSDCKLSSNGNVWKCHAEILERSWLENGKDIDIKCEEKYINRSVIPGGWSDKDSNDEQYKKLAEEALETYQGDFRSKYVHKLIQVNSVASQVDAGLKTKIDFTIGKTNCTLNYNIQSLMTCEYLYDVNALKCHAEILERQWLGEKHINVKCHEIGTKIKTLLQELSLYVGGEVEEDPEKIKYLFLAQESLNKYVSDIGSEYIHQIIKVDRAATQMVSGIRTIIDFTMGKTNCTRTTVHLPMRNCKLDDDANVWTCHAEIFQRSWLKNGRQINILCEEKSIRKRRFANSPVIPGGWLEEDIHDGKYKKLAQESLEKYQNDSGSEHVYKLLGINRVDIRMVARFITKIHFTMGEVNCKLSENIHLTSSCKWFKDTNVFKCVTEILDIPWLGNKKINVKCHETSNKIEIFLQVPSFNVGGKVEEDKNETYVDLARESLIKFESDTESKYLYQIIKVDHVDSEDLAGKNTIIKFTMGRTNCIRHKHDIIRSNCQISGDENFYTCVSEIWESMLLENGKQIDITCKENLTSLAMKQQVTDNLKFDNPNAFMELAQRSLRYIEAKYPHPRKQKIIRIFSLKKQLETDVHYRMEIEVGFTDCPALSIRNDCNASSEFGVNKICQVNIWLIDSGANFSVSCDHQNNTTTDLYKVQAEYLFQDFIRTYKPDYKDAIEVAKRFKIFKENIKEIHKFNMNEETAVYGVTRFTDLTYDEFMLKYTGLGIDDDDQVHRSRAVKSHLGLRRNVILKNKKHVPMLKAVTPDLVLPPHFDWRENGAVTKVKTQGSCGSCWAFSTTGNVEGQYKIKYGKLLSFSEQMLVDCDNLSKGCKGGWTYRAYRTIKNMGGLMTEEDYPYTGIKGKCMYNESLAKVKVKGAVKLSSNETEMAMWLVKHGPISVGINSYASKQYQGGIFQPQKGKCDPKTLDHAMLIVGFGTVTADYTLYKKDIPYWIVKNSWGSNWGDKGYYKIVRGVGACGINRKATSSLL